MTLKDLIYVKKCLGEKRIPIDIYKIRTMCIGAEERLEKVIVNGLDSFGKILHDPRITPLGSFLRKYWIDELPQLYNLIKGYLKIVGIRPMSENTWQRYPPKIMKSALKQKPGLMGITYAFKHSDNFNDKLEHMDRYLYKWEKDPVKTDREYLHQIFWNIFFSGTRSR